MGANICPMLMSASNGFSQSHGPPPSGDAGIIGPPHGNGHQNDQQSGCIFSSLFYSLSSWLPMGQNSHVASDDALRIASKHPHGH